MAKYGELRHFDTEQAFLEADIKEEMHIYIQGEYQEFPGTVGLLKKAIYDLVHAGRRSNGKSCADMTSIVFEHSKADACVFRIVHDEEAEMVVVVHVDDILTHANDQATMERFAAELGRTFKSEDMDYTSFFGGDTPLKSG